MKILITNTRLEEAGGTQLYAYDVALSLHRRGHQPVVYSPRLGRFAERFRQIAIPITDDLSSITTPPDVIHGQHHLETMTALMYFPATPCVFFCHGLLPWQEKPPHFPRIYCYVVMSDAVMNVLVNEHGVPPEKIRKILNFVALDRFHLRSQPLPQSPQNSLVFSNTASEANFLRAAQEACRLRGIEMDVIGARSGQPHSHPEEVLANYDLVFATGKSAIEGMAAGAAVILCDYEGLGPMVTTENLDRLRQVNFGLAALDRPHTVEHFSEQIARYDPQDAAAVTVAIRQSAGKETAVDRILAVYEETIALSHEAPPASPVEEARSVAAYLRDFSLSYPDELVGQIRQLQSQLRQLEDSLDQQTARAAGLEAELRRSQVDIITITHTRGYRLLQTWYRLKAALLPRRSR
jgi:hypothetical protein